MFVASPFTAFALLALRAAAQQFVMYTPTADDTSIERMDGILSPGKLFSHVHQVFGASGSGPNMTYDSLQSSDCTTMGSAESQGNADDNSVYWHPALYMQASNGSGLVRIPANGHKLYYKDAGSPDDQKRSPFEFPEGFRMLAGNAFSRAAAVNLQQQNITQWICHDSTGMNQGTSGGFPDHVTDCDATDGFNGAIHFPHCWNGQDFDQSAPDAHMSYPVGDIQEGICPTTHPIRLPHIFMENTFNLHLMVDQVVPNTFVLSQGDNTGYGWHADFYSGWVSGAIPTLLETCPQGEYGNEDVSLCPSFKPRTIKSTMCNLTTTYPENVNNPSALPGCNPIITTNPAPLFETAPLGVVTTNCPILSVDTSISEAPPANATILSDTTTSASPAATVASTASSSASTTPTSSSTSSTNSALSCPSANGMHYTDPTTGSTFEIQCGVDHVAGDLATRQVTTGLAGCIAACASTPGCVDVSLSGVACYMKKHTGAAISGDVEGALLITSSSASAPTTTPTLAARHVLGHLHRAHGRSFQLF